MCLSSLLLFFFFFNDPAPTEISPLPLHDAFPISPAAFGRPPLLLIAPSAEAVRAIPPSRVQPSLPDCRHRSEEHTSELQSPCNLVCRLLLEKKKKRLEEPVLPRAT